MKAFQRALCMTLMIAVLLTFSACYTQRPNPSGDETQTTQAPTQTEDRTENAEEVSLRIRDVLPTENLRAFERYQSVPDGRGLYVCSGETMKYYDFDTQKTMVLCTQTGCEHADSTCTAWMGKAVGFCVYRNLWYAAVENDDGSITLRKTDPATNYRADLYTIPCPEDRVLKVGALQAAYDNIYLQMLSEYIGMEETDSANAEGQEWIVQVNTDGSAAHEIQIEGSKSMYLLGASDRYVAVLYEYYLEDLLSSEEFYAQSGSTDDGTAYNEYWLDHYLTKRVMELRLYDIATWEYEKVADKNLAFSNLPCCYGNVIAYWTLDRDTFDSTIYLLDLSTKESRPLLKTSGVVNVSVFDGRVFFVRTDEAGENTFWWLDSDGGTEQQIKNNGDTDAYVFSVWGETTDRFLGLYTGKVGISWIYKTDLYKENYEAIGALT